MARRRPTAPPRHSAADRSSPWRRCACRNISASKGIVTRTGENEIDLAENDEWGSPLADDIASVLSENLSAMIPSNRVVQLPVSASVPVDYEVRVEIVSFERQPDGSVVLVARWTVFGDGGRRLVTMRRSGFRAGNVANDYPAITKAMSSLLGELSREIASTLRTAPPPRPLS